MQNKYFLLFISLILVIVGSSPMQASAPWNKERLCAIVPQQKIEYVNICWWENFSDPYIKYYIIKAIECNHKTKEASWKVEEYKYFVKIQFSQELPSLRVGGNYIGSHLAGDVVKINSNLFAIPFIASYEADIFGKNHDKTKSSKKAYQSAKYMEKSIYISLASDVATTYINIIKFDKQIQLQQQIVNTKKEELARAQSKLQRGVISVPELNDYKKAYENAKNSLDEYTKSRDKSLNQLTILIGESPDNDNKLKRNSFDKLEYKKPIPTSISSDVIFSRPDIMAAESDLEKANIDVRVARKEFLPSLNIYGLFAFSNIAGTFGGWNNSIAAIAAGLTQDLFKGGYKVANLKVYKTKYEQILEAYRQTDLNALNEVNDSLIMIKQDSDIDKNTTTNLATQKDTFQRATKSYKSGVISYPDLLNQKVSLLSVQQNQVTTKTQRLIDYITLYKSVGGNL